MRSFFTFYGAFEKLLVGASKVIRMSTRRLPRKSKASLMSLTSSSETPTRTYCLALNPELAADADLLAMDKIFY